MADQDLVSSLHRCEPSAFRELCELHLSSLWRFVVSRLDDDHHQAEDIVGETMLALVRALSSGTRIEQPGPWLRGVAHNKIRDHFRAVARVRHLIQRPMTDESQVERATPSDELQRDELRASVREVLETLNEQQRLALEWKYVDRLSVRQIALRWSVSEKATESILFRARQAFRRRMAQRHDLEEGDGRTPPSCSTRSATLKPTAQVEVAPLENLRPDHAASVHKLGVPGPTRRQHPEPPEQDHGIEST